MEIINTNNGEYKDVLNSFYNLERYHNIDFTGTNPENRKIVFQGYETSRSETLKKRYANYGKRIYLNLESPCAFTSTNSFLKEMEYFTHTLTICPYTAEWLEKHIDIEAIPIPFPYRQECFEKLNIEDKSVNTIYMGTLMCQLHYDMVDVVRKTNGEIISLYPQGNPTRVNISSQEKWKILASTKINLVANLCPITPIHKGMIKKYPYKDHGAFKYLNESSYLPQFKPRAIEAAVCKVLNLVYFDEWNVMEKWFVPGEEFIYWKTIEELESIVADVIANYDKYKPIVEAAYKKVKYYSIDNIMGFIEHV